ncbi:MAG: hypothetical protein NC898_03650 [Candidatus Omnitrophica bacterium]|nr:hypothetical protein [Candidatus Omnitrophota bacterium]
MKNTISSLFDKENKISLTSENLLKVVEATKRAGLLIGLFEVKSGDVLFDDFPSFLFTKKDDNFVRIKEIPAYEPGQGYFFLSPYLCNLWISLYRKDNLKDASPIYLIFSYHDEDFSKLEKAMERVLNLARSRNRKVIYLDELGLIPYETVRNIMEVEKIPEEEAFLKAKRMLAEELEGIEKGIPIYDSLDTYTKIYNFLAQNKIKSVMEDLGYQNWKNIISFDEQKFFDISFAHFVLNDISNYLRTIKIYRDNYGRYNIKDRDTNFTNQILRLKNDFPDAILFTIRGLSHIGLSEELTKQGINVEMVIIGEGILENNIIYQSMLHIYEDLNVKLPDEEEIYLKIIPQEYLRLYFTEVQHNSTAQATREANRLIYKLSKDDCFTLSRELKDVLYTGRFKNDLEGLYRFFYEWIQKRVSEKQTIPSPP